MKHVGVLLYLQSALALSLRESCHSYQPREPEEPPAGGVPLNVAPQYTHLRPNTIRQHQQQGKNHPAAAAAIARRAALSALHLHRCCTVQVTHFGQPVCEDADRVISRSGARQLHRKIYTHAVPPPRRDAAAASRCRRRGVAIESASIGIDESASADCLA